MDLHLAGRAVLVLGPGDYLDRAILRTLATEGASTLATHNGRQEEDLTQHGIAVSHWVSQEDEINALTTLRLRQFLASQIGEPAAIVMHVDVVKAISGRRPIRWWHQVSHIDNVLKETTDAALHASAQDVPARVILLYRLQADWERQSAVRWMRRTMHLVARKRHRDAVPAAPVNSVLVGAGAPFADAAHVVAFLCSSLAQEISGAVIPVDGGSTLRAEA